MALAPYADAIRAELILSPGPNSKITCVIQDKNDFDWSVNLVKNFNLSKRATVLFSPVHALMDPSILVEWILESGLDIRFQIQMHKVIWDPEARGV